MRFRLSLSIMVNAAFWCDRLQEITSNPEITLCGRQDCRCRASLQVAAPCLLTNPPQFAPNLNYS